MAYFLAPWTDTDIMLADPNNKEHWSTDYHTTRNLLRLRIKNLINRFDAKIVMHFNDYIDESTITLEMQYPNDKVCWNVVFKREPNFRQKVVELWNEIILLIQAAPKV